MECRLSASVSEFPNSEGNSDVRARWSVLRQAHGEVPASPYRLFFSQIVLQICLGTLTPIILLGITQLFKIRAGIRKAIYTTSGLLTMMGIFAMRWNVVIGGQLFSKSFLGYTTYKMALVTKEGLLVAIALAILPFIFLTILVKLLPPFGEHDAHPAPQPAIGD